MPLTPYQYRHTTPPLTEPPELLNNSAHSRNTSDGSFWSLDSSPDSIDTHVTTPCNRSPIRLHGPTLLPRIRTQDQGLEPSFEGSKAHRRALSQTLNPPGQPKPSRPAPYRSTTSPPECISLIEPLSATSTYSTAFSAGINSAVESPITLTPSLRRPGLGHGRSTSASSVDSSILSRHVYPTYRSRPSYVTSGYYSPSVTPGSSVYTPPVYAAPPPQAPYFELAMEQRCDQPDEATVTPNDYLRGHNPTIDIVRQINAVTGRGMHSHFWWDIRNLRTWEDFDLDTIMEVPGFPELLSVPVNAAAFPQPHISHSPLRPESEATLVDLIRDFYMVKVNAALKVSLGAHRHIAMRVCKDRDSPSFISNYEDDVAKMVFGNGKGRVVGIVKSYERWNTGMRVESPNKKVLYLLGLSHLQRYMREHQCRYGFIMTETELVCVRAGTAEMPYFGFLELAPTIEARTTEGMTSCLALWYLHMLAKEEPLPGQCSWKINVGPPAALTRSNVMEKKDDWIPNPQNGETREAKRVRGWVHPSDPWNRKKEGGGLGRRRQA